MDGHTNTELEIIQDNLDGQAIAELLQTHLSFARASSPACAVHALDIERLKHPSITFWSAWHTDQLLGCVALKELSPVHGEIKSMHTSSSARR